MRVLRNYLIFSVCFLGCICAVLTVCYFPTQVDEMGEVSQDEAAEAFYESVYESTEEGGDSDYVEYAPRHFMRASMRVLRKAAIATTSNTLGSRPTTRTSTAR